LTILPSDLATALETLALDLPGEIEVLAARHGVPLIRAATLALVAILTVVIASGNHLGSFHNAGCGATTVRTIAAHYGDRHARMLESQPGVTHDDSASGCCATCTVIVTGHFRVQAQPSERIVVMFYRETA
jgi:hypothetical protein